MGGGFEILQKKLSTHLLHTLDEKSGIFQKNQEKCETFKNEMEHIVDITNPTQSQKSKHIPPPHSTYKKIKNLKLFQKPRNGAKRSKILLKALKLSKMRGKSTSIHFFRTRKISKKEQKTKTCFNLEFLSNLEQIFDSGRQLELNF